MPRDADWDQRLTHQVRQHGRLFFSLAYGLVNDRTAAEDVVQQALLEAWAHREELHDPNSLHSWIRRALRTQSLQLVRRRKLEQRVGGSGILPRRREDHPPHHHYDRYESVLVALEKLPEALRDVVVLCEMAGLKGTEAAELLGIGTGTVSTKRALGIELLRKHLADWRPAEGDRT